MKIPESIRIGGVEYEIKMKDVLLLDNKMQLGVIHYQECEIELLSEGTGHQQRCVTLIHEICHGIMRHMGLECDNEEEIVDAFARGFFMVLQDNGDRLFDLKKEENDDE